MDFGQILLSKPSFKIDPKGHRGVCRDVIGRELRARGIAPGHIKADRRARRPGGGPVSWA
jgi:hypothetical protein